jgi:G6PDH family F420-dependent oxidoreductase
VSGFGPKAVEDLSRFADGFMSTNPDAEMVSRFKEATGGKPAQAGCKVAWADTREEGVDHAYRLWPNAGLPGELAQVLPSVRHFEQASSLVTRDAIAESAVAGRDPDEHLAQLREYRDAGFDEVYVANMGPHYREMIEAYGHDVLPTMRSDR